MRNRYCSFVEKHGSILLLDLISLSNVIMLVVGKRWAALPTVSAIFLINAVYVIANNKENRKENV